jgi:FHS family L-fucose permease-like MFS transporter
VQAGHVLESQPDAKFWRENFAALLVTASMVLGGHSAMWTILAVGFFNSIMFSTIFSLGVAELGPLTGSGSGLLNMAIVGGAILPVIQGAIADRVGLHHAFMLPVICYLYIIFFALSGRNRTARDM